MEPSAALAPAPPSTSALIYETTVKMAAGDPPGMFAAASPGDSKPLDAHHKMLHEGSILSSHLQTYEGAITKFLKDTNRFFAAANDFLLSAGQPSKYEHKLSDKGTKAAATATAALAAAAGTTSTSEQSTASAIPATQAATPVSKEAPSATSAAAAGCTAFGPEASKPTLPIGPNAVGVYLCPGVPGTPALGAHGLTDTAPADICLPAQHEALFRHDMQRSLVASGRDCLADALQDKLLPALQVWLATYSECKALLPQAERMRLATDAARSKLEQAKAKVLEAEAAQPLVSEQQLQQEGIMPRVLVQSVAAGELVAAPAAQARQEMYNAETVYTDTSLAFELTEKVLRDKLTWLMKAGGGLKATIAAAMAHALRAAAAQGDPGTAAGGSATGKLRAPREEVLEPFPEHVLARLAGGHLPTLPQLVLADARRLGRWGARYRDAMQAAAAATAAVAGAQMLAAAAAPAGAVTNLEAVPENITEVLPGGGVEQLARTDGSQAGKQADANVMSVAADINTAATSEDVVDSSRERAADAGLATDRDAPLHSYKAGAELQGGGPKLAEGTAASTVAGGSEGGMVTSAGAQNGGAVSGKEILESRFAGEIKQAAAASHLPLDLLAAAVEADVETSEASAANKGKVDIAWRLLHQASVVAAKEEAVLLPAVSKYVGSGAAEVLLAQHRSLADRLAKLGQEAPASPGFDLAVLEVLEVVDDHAKELESSTLPALAAVDQHTLQDLAKQYRRAAATAPTRPHGWFLGTPDIPMTSAAEHGTAAGVAAATRDTLKRMLAAPVKAGVALVDAAADVARFGPGKAPDKF